MKQWIPLNVDDEFKDDTIPLELVPHKEIHITSKTLHNFMVQFENKTLKDELQLDLIFKKNRTQ